MTRVGTAHTVQLTRTIEIEVETTVHIEQGELEIQCAIDCSTGDPIELTDDEIDHIHATTLPNFVQGLADGRLEAQHLRASPMPWHNNGAQHETQDNQDPISTKDRHAR